MDEDDIIYILNIDLGSVNFSFVIEEINLKYFKNIKNIPKNERYNIDGSLTHDFEKILDEVYKNGKIVLFRNINLKSNIKDISKDHEIFKNMIDCLDEYKEEYFDKVNYVVIEKQMKINQKACRLSVCCITYFIMNYDTPIFEFDSFHKTQVLGCKKDEKKLKNGKIIYKAVDKPKRKKWSIENGSYILSLRDEIETFVDIFDIKKNNDIYDNINMCQAFKYLYFIDKIKL